MAGEVAPAGRPPAQTGESVSLQPGSAAVGVPASGTPPPPDAPAASAVPAASAQMPTRYIGLISRAAAFAIDAAVINVVAIVVEVGVALILSLVHVSNDLEPVLVTIGAVAYALWGLGYFVGFWSGTGQTPGSRVMQIRVVASEGGPIKPRRALVRCIGLLLAALPLFAGFVPILFDRRRRGLQDYMARTVVVDAPQLSAADVRRAQLRRRRTGPGVVGDGRQERP